LGFRVRIRVVVLRVEGARRSERVLGVEFGGAGGGGGGGVVADERDIKRLISLTTRELTFNGCEIIARFTINDALNTIESG